MNENLYKGKHENAVPLVPGEHRVARRRGLLLRRYVTLSVLLLIVEFGVLFFMDRAVRQDAAFESVKLLPPITAATWELPADVSSRLVGVSYDGHYAAYQDGQELIIVDLSRRRLLQSIPIPGERVSLLEWLPDRERLIYALYYPDGSNDPGLHAFDADTGETRLVHSVARRSPFSKVVDLSLSPYTNLIYLKVDDGAGNLRLYRLDVMGDMYRARFTQEPGGIAVLPHKDQVIVEQSVSGDIWAVSGVLGTERVLVEQQGSRATSALLGADSEDRVYLGELAEDGRHVLSVRRGQVGMDFTEVWRGDDRPLRGNLTLGHDDVLYLNNPRAHTITALTGRHRVVRYRGGLVAFDGRLLAVRDGNRLTVNAAP